MSDQAQTDDYKFFELETLEEVFQPIQGSTRVKYTCLDVSANYLILGANSGSLYIFQRHPQLHHLKVLTSKKGAVTTICISPNEKYYAVATSKGVVSVIQHDLPTKPLHVSEDHIGSCVTCLYWRPSGGSLYIGDDRGKVTSVNITLKKAHSIFQATTSLIVQLTSKVVQLDISDNQLLVSCHTGTFLCDIVKETYSRIGSKPREGHFGSCFYMGKTIYCARPGSRLWEVDFKGRVLFTHQLKKALVNPPPPVVSITHEEYSPTVEKPDCIPLSVNFNLLLVIRFIITWAGIHLFVLDLPTATIILWSSLDSEIRDVRITGSEIYIHFENGKFRHFNLSPVNIGIEKLINRQHWKLAANLCVLYKETILTPRRKIERKHLQKLLANLNDEEQISKQITWMITRLEELYPPSKVDENGTAYRIESGIVVVNRPNGLPPLLPKNNPSQPSKPPNGYRTTSNLNHDRDHFDSHNIGFAMPFSSNQFLDPDIAHMGYEAITSITSNISFSDMKSKYNSGKDKILATMGQLEDRLKATHAETAPPLLDVRSLQNPKDTIDHKDTEDGTKSCAEHQTQAKLVDQETPSHVRRFIEMTNDTWNKIPSMGYDKEKLSSILRDWVLVLNDTQVDHYKYSMKPAEEKNKIIRSVSCENLAVRAPTERRRSCPSVLDGCNWSVGEFLWWQTTYFNSEVLNFTFPWMHNWHTLYLCSDDYFRLSHLASLCLTHKIFGQIGEYNNGLQNSHESTDHACALFIHQFFHLLNPHHIRAEFEKDLQRSYKMSWASLMKCLLSCKHQNPEFSLLLECFLMASKSTPDLLPELLNKLTVASEIITPRDVFYLDEQAHLNGNLLLLYMDETLDRQFCKACEDPIVSYQWIKAILQNHTIVNCQLQCTCGTPRAGSHKYPWQRNDLLMQILRASNVSKISTNLFKEYGYWLGYMYSCHKTLSRTDALSTMVCLSDIQLFQDPCNAVLLPQTDDEWKFVFDAVNKLVDRCVICQEDLTYESWPLLTVESIAEIAIQYMNPQSVIHLLSKLEPKPKMSSQFLRMSIMTAAKKIKQRANYLGGINHFVWARYQNYASAEIRSKLLNESFSAPNVPNLQYKENVRSQWGIGFDMKSLCSKCSLPLIVPLTEQHSSLGGIRVFCCGHSSHLFCIRQGESDCHLCRTASQLK